MHSESRPKYLSGGVEARESREHELKCWPEFFQAILAGNKTFEYRKDDRGYQIGDVLFLREWKPQSCEYTGREIKVFVSYMIRLNDYENHVVMSILRL